ncbi:MAG: hypothetical protein BME94_04720 [Methanobacteriales archaeon Met13]
MKIKTSYLILETNSPLKEGANQLRGYIGNQYPEHLALHHHLEGTQYLYTYPKVQYKVMGGTPSLLGIDEGADVVREISGSLDELLLGNNTYSVEQKIIYERNSDVRSDKNIQYKFITPWIGLNSKNYGIFSQMRDWKEKKALLNKTLVGNILSMCKGLGIIANRRLEAHSHLDPERVSFKGIEVLGFTGQFKVNFRIPDFFGLGKGVSQGFGTVKEVRDANSGDL